MSGLGHLAKQASRHAEAGRHDAAVLVWERLHRQAPKHAGISLALGAALLAAGRTSDAKQWLLRCLEKHPSDAAITRLLGRALVRGSEFGPAVGAFYHALALEPDHEETHAGLANALFLDRQSQAALPHALRACELAMSDPNLSTLMGVLVDLDQIDRALAIINVLLSSGTLDRGTLKLHQSHVLLAAAKLDDAVQAAREASRLSPGNPVARHTLAAGLLLQGELTPEAWSHYEGRVGLLKAGKWPAPHLRWHGQSVDGRTVLIHAEQGLGDTLQFVRYVPMVAALGARVILAVQPSLVRLLQGTPGAAEIVAAGTLPPFDFYVPLLSLPGVFETTIETIPPPLVYSLPGQSRPQRRRASALQVGIVWAGRPSFADDRKRSLAPAALAPLATIEGVDFVSLQFEAGAPAFPGMQDGMQGVTDFAETVERIADLDLVISVDTAVAHLAATMGKPVWLLARHSGCWRWMQTREDSPWYPTVRLFRQTRNSDWADVLERVTAELTLLASQQGSTITLAA